jgi:hypothetical protein
LDKQLNLVFGLGFQKRISQLADAELANIDDARFLQLVAKALDISIMLFLS